MKKDLHDQLDDLEMIQNLSSYRAKCLSSRDKLMCELYIGSVDVRNIESEHLMQTIKLC
jgi:hypothetical protein